jgi:hypothetical protein
MNIAFIIYDGMTALDFIGVYDPVTRLKTMGFITSSIDLGLYLCEKLAGHEVKERIRRQMDY